MDIRTSIQLIEQGNPEDEDWRQAIADQDWKEAINLSETPEQIAAIIEASGAEEISFRTNPHAPHVWLLDDDILEWDGKGQYPDLTDKTQWVYDADLETYFPGYEGKFNEDFWRHPSNLFHATDPKNVTSIQANGLRPENKTRGLNNRSVAHAVFTTHDYDSAAEGHYGEAIFEIDMVQMDADGYKPYVSEEPPIVEQRYRSNLAHMIGVDDFVYDEESGINEDTVIIFGNIPKKYLTLLDD